MNLKDFIFFLLAVTLLMPVSSGGGELYKWVDDKGNIHYGDKPPKKAELKEIAGNISSFKTVEIEAFKFDPSLVTVGSKSSGKSVVMYSTSWCGYCKKARKHFEQNKIPYQEYDIEKSKQAARDYKKLKGRGVPVILIGDRRMNGFSANKFDKIYYEKS
jgi:glutaredoxin